MPNIDQDDEVDPQQEIRGELQKLAAHLEASREELRDAIHAVEKRVLEQRVEIERAMHQNSWRLVGAMFAINAFVNGFFYLLAHAR